MLSNMAEFPRLIYKFTQPGRDRQFSKYATQCPIRTYLEFDEIHTGSVEVLIVHFFPSGVLTCMQTAATSTTTTKSSSNIL